MEQLNDIQKSLNDELSRIRTVKSIDEYLEQIDQVKDNFNANVTNPLREYRDMSIEYQTVLGNINKSLNILTLTLKEKFDSAKSQDNSKDIDETELQEKIDLDRAKLTEEGVTNNSTITEVIESIKTSETVIKAILQVTEESKANVTLCEKMLSEKQKQIDEIRLQKEQEEKAKIKAEQEEIERVKEEARLEEMRVKEMEKMKRELEQTKTDSESTKDKFNIKKLEVKAGEFNDNSIGCYIRTKSDCVISPNDLKVKVIDPLEISCDFDATQEIISNIITISSVAREDECFQFEQAFSVILPHNLGRSQAKEPCIFQYSSTDETWMSLPTQDVPIDDVDKSVGATVRFVEAVFCEIPLILTVNSIPRMENVSYGKKGCNWSSSTDQRVGISIPASAVKVNLEFGIMVLPFDASFIQDMKLKSKGTVVDNIYSFTHVINMDSNKRRCLKPVSISMPLPLKQSVKSESNSVPGLSLGGGESKATSKLSSFGAQNMEDSEEKIKLFTLDSNKNWVENTTNEIEMEKKDMMKFDINEFKTQTFIGLRTKPDSTNDQIARGINSILDHLKLRQVKVIVSYHVDKPSSLAITTCPVIKLDRVLRLLKEDGYSEHNQQISPMDIEIKEREKLSLRFRGNVRVCNKDASSASDDEGFVISYRYCSQLKNRIKVQLEVVDKYAQRSKSSYQGFVTVTMSKWTRKPRPKQEGDNAPRKGPPPLIDVEEIVPLYESMLEISKSDADQKSGKSDTLNAGIEKFHFSSRDYVTEDLLKTLSTKLNDDWYNLAKALSLPKSRLEELTELNKSSNPNADNNAQNNPTKTKMAYQVLKLWVMHLPVSKDKEMLLRKALVRINREDVVKTHLTH